MESANVTYKDLKVGNKTLKFRKWKVKDRQKLRDLIAKNKTPESASKIMIQTLVFDCLDKEYPLNIDEIQYVFNQMRIENIGADIEIEYKCPACEKNVKQKLLINDFHVPQFSDGNIIGVEDLKIELQDVLNAKEYNKKIWDSKDYWIDDLIFHIKSLNGDETLSFNALKEFIEDLDVAILDSILDQYEKIRFNLKKEYALKCPECENTRTIIFDEIPDFLPAQWLLR